MNLRRERIVLFGFVQTFLPPTISVEFTWIIRTIMRATPLVLPVAGFTWETSTPSLSRLAFNRSAKSSSPTLPIMYVFQPVLCSNR